MSAPGVVVVHGGDGRGPDVREYADELTMAGFDVEVVDLDAGPDGADTASAARLAHGTGAERPMARVAAAVARLRDRGSGSVGAVGFSLGGDLVLRAVRDGGLDAVVAYDAVRPRADAARTGCPVQLHGAGTGTLGVPDDVAAYVAALEAAGTPVDHFTYPGTRSGTVPTTASPGVPGMPGVLGADARTAEVARARTIGFLHARLAR